MLHHSNRRWARRQLTKLIRELTLFRYWEHLTHFSMVNVTKTFPAFAANSSGSYRSKARLARASINETVPLLARLCRDHVSKIESVNIDSQLSNPFTNALLETFQKHGGDKSSFHNYHLVYGSLFDDPTKVKKVFEIGLGSNNPEVVSSMGFHGTPGASLRAFREFFPNAQIFGADIDERVLFQENRISTFFIDQLSDASFENLPTEASGDLDLFIDDGLHSPDANLRSLMFGLKAVRPGGFVVIEDIREEAIDIWRVASALLPEDCQTTLYRGTGAWMFVVKRGKA
jgi:SAM-dependent methyltransferase